MLEFGIAGIVCSYALGPLLDKLKCYPKPPKPPWVVTVLPTEHYKVPHIINFWEPKEKLHQNTDNLHSYSCSAIGVHISVVMLGIGYLVTLL